LKSQPSLIEYENYVYWKRMTIIIIVHAVDLFIAVVKALVCGGAIFNAL
jgi:hypothetical protein